MNYSNLDILVTGGAGYIGSHTVLLLNELGCRVTVLDNLSTGISEAVLMPAKLVQCDLADISFLEQFFRDNSFDAVIHFAGSTVVPDSVVKPIYYYQNNVINTINLLKFIRAHKIPKLIFSSTAAVYGIPEKASVSELDKLAPINPYGRTKLMVEQIIQDLAQAESWFKYGILRYFNVAGCDPAGRLGQNTPNATHLIKLACQAILGIRPKLLIYGNDFPTIDGTGVRDYIHVSDLAAAHIELLHFLHTDAPSSIFNCGYGKGYSVLEVINTVENISGKKLPTKVVSRRQGDPPAVIADPKLLRSSTNWQPRYDDIQVIVETALAWERRLMASAINSSRNIA
jgi:UDP-glucose 4-epimerase